MFCGVFTPKSTLELEDCAETSSVSHTRNLSSFDCSQNSDRESPPVFTSGAVDTTSTCEDEGSSERNSSALDGPFVESVLLNAQSSRVLEPFPHPPPSLLH